MRVPVRIGNIKCNLSFRHVDVGRGQQAVIVQDGQSSCDAQHGQQPDDDEQFVASEKSFHAYWMTICGQKYGFIFDIFLRSPF